MRQQDRLAEPVVACVLVSWNNWKHTERCLRALSQQTYGELQVIVVDNGSTDDSLLRIRSTFPSVLCIKNGYNSGFAKACNIGARRAIENGAELLWFLNNDTEAPPDTARKLVNVTKKDATIGVVGSVLFYMHEPRSVQAWGGGDINLWSGYNRHFIAPHDLEKNTYITFASAMVRRKTFEELGGLWEQLFMYFEDVDFSLRAREAGWSLAVAEDTAILHVENGSGSRLRTRNPRMERIQMRSGLVFLRRHGKVPAIAMAVFLMLRVAKRIVLGDWQALWGVMEGIGDYLSGRMTPSADVRDRSSMP